MHPLPAFWTKQRTSSLALFGITATLAACTTIFPETVYGKKFFAAYWADVPYLATFAVRRWPHLSCSALGQIANTHQHLPYGRGFHRQGECNVDRVLAQFVISVNHCRRSFDDSPVHKPNAAVQIFDLLRKTF